MTANGDDVSVVMLIVDDMTLLPADLHGGSRHAHGSA